MDGTPLPGTKPPAASARRVSRADAEALVVVGGDGMVHLGVNSLGRTGLPLGIVPVGTGNDVARMLGLPLQDVEGSCARVISALADGGRVLDAGRITTGGGTVWFAGAVSAGFDAAVNERANSWRRPRGTLRYTLAMLRELGSFRAINCAPRVLA